MALAVKIEPVRKAYGTPWSKMSNIPVSRDILEQLGKCLINAILREVKRDFALRGWSAKMPNGRGTIFTSFSSRVVGGSTVEILSTYPGLKELTEGIPPRRMTWLTQEAKDQRPRNYPLTPGEKKRGMRRSGRVSRGERMPLIVPLRNKSGAVILRYAPLTTAQAWVHPGIAKFTFMRRAIEKGRKECAVLLREVALDALKEGDPTK